VPACWPALAWLLTGPLRVSGPVGQQGAAPSFAFTVPLGSADVPGLGALAVSFVLSSTTVPGTKPIPGFPSAPYLPQVTLGITAEIVIAQTKVPVFIDLSMLPGAVPVVVDVSKLSLVQLADLAAVTGGHDLSSALPSKDVFDPGQYLSLQTLTFVLDPATPALLSAAFTMGTIKSWPITNGLSAGPVILTFMVDIGTGQIFAGLTGDIGFNGGTLRLGAAYPGFIFSGGLTDGSTVDLSALIGKLLTGGPVQPKLILDRLDFIVSPLNGGSFSLTTELTGDWSTPVGPATLALTRAGLQLDRQPGGNAGGGTSGSIMAQAQLTPPGVIGQPVTFDGSWTLPGTFALTGKFPEIHLTELARFSGIPVPDGVPEIDLTAGTAAIVLDTGTGDYMLGLAAQASANGTALGGATFVVRRTPTAFGFLVGIVVADGWTPAQTWPELRDVFGDLTVSKAGVLVSTLPAGSAINLPALKNLPSLPATAPAGFAFFCSLALQGPALGWMAGLFGENTTLDLLAIVNTSAPAQSSFVAALRSHAVNNQITWTELSVAIQPATTTFTIRAAATFQFPDAPPLQLSGEGSVTLSPLSATLSVGVKDWTHPFGIQDLVIREFALQIGWKDGAELTIGALGSFVIGIAPRAFVMTVSIEIIDFEAPGALVFELDKPDKTNPLKLTDIIEQFTSLELSSVPVLNAIAFGFLKFAVVDDPAGFKLDGYTYPPGIGVAADILLWDWEATFSIVVNASTGIYAKGQINKPITVGPIFTLSDSTGKTGPSGLIDTSKLPSRTDQQALALRRDWLFAGGVDPYFTLDGKVSLLGIETVVKAQAAGQTFDFDLSWSFLGAVTATLQCHLADATHFSAAAGIKFGLDVTLGPYSVFGIPLIPEVHIQTPDAALMVGLAINPQVIVQLSLGLSYTWAGSPYQMGFTLSVADIASKLTELWPAVKAWMIANAKQVFNEALSSAEKWIELLLGPFAVLAADIGLVAEALATFFGVIAADAAALLIRLGYAFMEIVDALVQFFKMLFDDALHLVESLMGDCGMETAEDQAYGAGPGYTMRDIAFELTRSSAGQHLLELYYSHQAELTELLAPHPYLHDMLRSFATSPQRARDTRLMADVAVKALFLIAPDASPRLRADADEMIAALMRYRDMTVPAVLAELAAA